MHPAYSVIFFTAASGTGYGLLGLMGILAASGHLPAYPNLGLVGLAVALLLITGGLLSSMAHLGHPERFLRALTQWRSSWLSREGIAAILTYLPAAWLGIGWVFFADTPQSWRLAGPITAGLALITVWSTAMIYASLPTVPQWHTMRTNWVYLALAVAGGALLLNVLRLPWIPFEPLFGGLAVAGLALAWLAKEAYWRHADGGTGRVTAEAATGLGALGKVRLFESPHTESNYLMQEMGYRLARRHATRLRALVRVLLFAVPMGLVGVSLLLQAGSQAPPGASEEVVSTAWTFEFLGGTAAVLALFPAGLGLIMERWLFFAEAKHMVMLYYGAETV